MEWTVALIQFAKFLMFGNGTAQKGWQFSYRDNEMKRCHGVALSQVITHTEYPMDVQFIFQQEIPIPFKARDRL